MKRRTVLGLGVLGGAAMATPFAVSRFGAMERAPLMTTPRFELPLKIPPVLDPTKRTGTQDEYDIVQQEAEQEILPGRSRAWRRPRHPAFLHGQRTVGA